MTQVVVYTDPERCRKGLEPNPSHQKEKKWESEREDQVSQPGCSQRRERPFNEIIFTGFVRA